MENFGQETIEIKKCKICGDRALYHRHGVLACDASKSFLKRYVKRKQKSLPCLSNNQCEINRLTRHHCTACRLKKCFESGMQIELMRHSPGQTKTNKKQLESKTKRLAIIPTLNLVRKDTSSMTGDQWILLTNLTKLYDQSKFCHLVQCLGPSSHNTNEAVFKQLVNTFYEKGGETCRKNVDFQRLSFSDQSVLLPTAINNVTCLGGIYTCVQRHLNHHQGYMTYVDAVYGKLTTNYHRWASTFVRCDGVLFKLALALFALSTNSRLLHPNLNEEYVDVKPILDIESRYAELTWKYLLYKYSFQEAVERYVQLIRWFLAMSVFMYYAHCSALHSSQIQTVVESVELDLILDDVDDIVTNLN